MTQSLCRKTHGGAIGATATIFFLVNGIGQGVLTISLGILALAFRSLPRDGEQFLINLVYESMPWVQIVMGGVGKWWEKSDAWTVFLIGAGWAIAYLLAGTLQVAGAARRFAHYTGRADRPYAPPGPPPDSLQRPAASGSPRGDEAVEPLAGPVRTQTASV